MQESRPSKIICVFQGNLFPQKVQNTNLKEYTRTLGETFKFCVFFFWGGGGLGKSQEKVHASWFKTHVLFWTA